MASGPGLGPQLQPRSLKPSIVRTSFFPILPIYPQYYPNVDDSVRVEALMSSMCSSAMPQWTSLGWLMFIVELRNILGIVGNMEKKMETTTLIKGIYWACNRE